MQGTDEKTADAVVDEGDFPSTFDEFGLSEEVSKAISGMGFEEPTPVQARCFGEVMKGHDVIVMAQTGTGKTAAFGIPLAERLDAGRGAVQALVLNPTRELALQVSREVNTIGKQRGVKCAAVYGGASFTRQVDEVRDGAQIVVGTPGRVLDHMRRGTIDYRDIKVLVLDEADEMLSMGFEKEISEIIEGLPRERQTMLFSATIPDDIQRLAQRYMGEAVTISVSGDAVAAAEISHFVYLVSGLNRPRDLVKVLDRERPGSAIIFCNTKDQTQTVARFLKNEGIDADWINSDLSQAEREKVMGRTRKGKLKYLVATDVAARGIDISHLSHVINYSFPESLEVYIHRTGRTGRMGRHGAAISLITPQDIGNLYYLRLTYKIFPVEKALPGDRDTSRSQELDRLDSLRRAYGGKLQGDFVGLARRLLSDARSERILAGLLADRFANGDSVIPAPAAPQPAEPEPEPEETTAKPSAEEAQPAPEEEAPAAPEPTPEKKPPARRSKRPSRAPKRSSRAPAADDGEEPVREVYVDAGRRDGLRISTMMKQVVEATGLPRAAIGKVRMLSRSTFIAVPERHVRKVIKALKSVEIDGRKLKAEPAHES